MKRCFQKKEDWNACPEAHKGGYAFEQRAARRFFKREACHQQQGQLRFARREAVEVFEQGLVRPKIAPPQTNG